MRFINSSINLAETQFVQDVPTSHNPWQEAVFACICLANFNCKGVRVASRKAPPGFKVKALDSCGFQKLALCFCSTQLQACDSLPKLARGENENGRCCGYLREVDEVLEAQRFRRGAGRQGQVTQGLHLHLSATCTGKQSAS